MMMLFRSAGCFEVSCSAGLLVTDSSDLEIDSTVYRTCNNTQVTKLIIADTATRIIGQSFMDWHFLQSVDLGSGHLAVGGVCFRYCNRLTNVKIGPNVISFGAECFADAAFGLTFQVDAQNLNIHAIYNNQILISKTTAIQMSRSTPGGPVFPEYVDQVGGVFSYMCPYVENVTFLCPLKSVGYACFYQCQSLKQINLVNPTAQVYTLFGKKMLIASSSIMWASTSLTGSLVIPKGITGVSYGAFWGSGVENLVFPKTATSIGTFGLHLCANLSNVTFEGRVSFGTTPFSGASVQSLVFASPRQQSVNVSLWRVANLKTIVVHCDSTANFSPPKGVTVDRNSICGTRRFTATLQARFPHVVLIFALHHS